MDVKKEWEASKLPTFIPIVQTLWSSYLPGTCSQVEVLVRYVLTLEAD